MGLDQTHENLAYGLMALDEAAFEELLDAFEAPVYRFFFYSVRDEEQAIEMSNQTFSEFVCALKAGKFHSPARLRGFVFGIARNVLKRYLRKKQRNRVSCSDQMDQHIHRQACGLEMSHVRETLQQVFCVIDGLQGPERQVMLLRFVEGMATKEIAEAMSIPVNSVKSYIYRSRQQLTTIMGDAPGGLR